MGYCNRKIGKLVRGTDMAAEFGFSLAEIIRNAAGEPDDRKPCSTGY